MDFARRKVTWLLMFGVAISAPRFVGAYGSAIGLDALAIYPFLVHLELLSGFALAIFEGIALAYIVNSMRSIQLFADEDKDKDWKQRIQIENAIYWAILLIGSLFMLITIPAVTTPHMVGMMFGVPVREILNVNHMYQNAAIWMWIIIVCGVQTIFVFLIGIAYDKFDKRVLQPAQEKEEPTPQEALIVLEKGEYLRRSQLLKPLPVSTEELPPPPLEQQPPKYVPEIKREPIIAPASVTNSKGD